MRAAAPIGLAVALLAQVSIAATAADVIAVPVGWTERELDARARSRAEAWIEGREDARALAVLTTRARDEFAETLAVIELAGAWDLDASAEAELRRALAGTVMLPDEGVTIETGIVPEAVASARARWSIAGIAHEAVLVPSGPQRRLVLLAVQADELPLYRTTMTEALAGLTGIAPPIEPFATKPLRRVTIAAWALLTAGALAFALWRRPFGADARTIGRVLALACLVLAALVAALAWSPLESREDSLRVAGLSPTTMAAELFTYGLLAAACCWIAGLIVARGEGPVASAPSTGAFADRSLAIPRVPVPRAEPHDEEPSA